MSKTLLRHTLTKHIFDICVDFLIFIHFHLMKIHRLLSSLQRRNIFRQYLGIGYNSYPLVYRRPAETVSLQRRQICYRWATPVYWPLVPRSSMFYLFEFCLKNMWNCSLIQHIWSHSFYDWKLCELFLLSGFLICHAVGWYIELKIQKFWWRIPKREILI
jgi:hypothetical protein